MSDPGRPRARRAARAAVVFDCDGLLLNTGECWMRAVADLFAEHGRAFDQEMGRMLIGTNAEGAGRIMAELLDRPDRGIELAAALLERAEAEVLVGASPRPGAAALVGRLGEHVPLGVASNSPRFLVEAALRAAGLGKAFRVVVGDDDVPRPKPAPDAYLLACWCLGVDPSLSVALEDSPVGVAAARAAGMYVVGVPSIAGVDLDADLVVPSLADPAVPAKIEHRLTAGARRVGRGTDGRSSALGEGNGT